MRRKLVFEVDNSKLFKAQLLEYTRGVQFCAIYDSCDHYLNSSSPVHYHSYDYLAGIGSIGVGEGTYATVSNYLGSPADWQFGYFSYDLKNEFENLYSVNHDGLHFPSSLFFQPRYVVYNKESKWIIEYQEKYDTEDSVVGLVDAISLLQADVKLPKSVLFEPRITKEKYIQSVNSVLDHIHKGDIYELNYCQEFFASDVSIDAYIAFERLKNISPTPFACFLKLNDKYVISASPERYLKKEGNKLISQPIKGTAPRGGSWVEDEAYSSSLQQCEKERSENIMIADLVRNDLSRVAARGSVHVEELCGIYKFPQVFQMITTVTAELEEGRPVLDAIVNSFPMGSMTGAPKVRAMKLIEKYEETKRGVYSGAVGYFAPNGDFDFNVIIRSLLYNSAAKYLSFMVGSAITEKSIPEKEYEECLVKASAIFKLFKQEDRKLS
ncbi:anthranilate synthase component I family protein [Plebeiibacterium marinum]|uniref:Anthranilate synthase component I family protein n=1 Tax=Plebeiibacterium marinum TaxID=2992111 RepID=A0AAE3MBG1_9BACT|nr:anthranilate synthase component I family protein [Plebeiobacterium marinum]MCW3804813.1 anthranilate synthase component I family protein [Plebeiobacterium marinum]